MKWGNIVEKDVYRTFERLITFGSHWESNYIQNVRLVKQQQLQTGSKQMNRSVVASNLALWRIRTELVLAVQRCWQHAVERIHAE